MHEKALKPLAVVGVVGLVVFGLYSISLGNLGTSGQLMAAENTGRIKLPRLGMEIDKVGVAGELVFETEKARNVGTIVWVKAKTSEMMTPCYLGAYYILDKKKVSELLAADFSELMRRAVLSDNFMSPKAKEFKESFFIFEPNRKACPGSLFEVKREVELREGLYKSVSSASITR